MSVGDLVGACFEMPDGSHQCASFTLGVPPCTLTGEGVEGASSPEPLRRVAPAQLDDLPGLRELLVLEDPDSRPYVWDLPDDVWT